MKVLQKHQILTPGIVALLALLLGAPSAYAFSSFNSSATLTYTITSIANLSNPGDLSGLSITGAFDPDVPPNWSYTVSGDGSVSDGNPSTGAIAITPTLGASFSHNFAVSGNVGNGSVDSLHLGLFSLALANTSGDTYSIGLTLGYQLDGAVSGLYANSAVYLDYYNETSSFAGSDQINVSWLGSASAAAIGTSGLFNFTLDPAASEKLYGDVRITGSLEATAVPIPGSFWSFFACLSALLSLGKRKYLKV